MLVLSRKQNEEIFIGENVSIRILAVSGNRIRVGITAPASVEIRRAEIDFGGDTTAECAGRHNQLTAAAPVSRSSRVLRKTVVSR